MALELEHFAHIQLAHQQRIIAIVDRYGDNRRSLHIHGSAKRALERFRGSNSKTFSPKSFSINFKVNGPKLNP